MKSIYSISKGQLITVWVFGLIGLIASLGESDYSGFAKFLSILIPALLVFYTIGWRNFNKSFINIHPATKDKIKDKLNTLLAFLKKQKIALIIGSGIFIAALIISSALKQIPPISLDKIDSGEDLKKAASYARENPNSDYAEELKRRLLAGQYNDEIKEAGGKLPENNFNQPTCKGNIGEIVIIDNKYQTFEEHDYDSSIKFNENGIRFYGVLKNNSICPASNINIKVTLQSTKNPDLKQEETRMIFFGSLTSQQTKQYEISFDAFETLLVKQKDQFGLNTTVKSSLRSDVTAKVEVVSAIFGLSN